MYVPSLEHWAECVWAHCGVKLLKHTSSDAWTSPANGLIAFDKTFAVFKLYKVSVLNAIIGIHLFTVPTHQ